MANIYFHVGLHKTGTSAIQWYCNNHRAWLQENGIYYPPADNIDAHHGLSTLLRVKNGGYVTKDGSNIFLERFEKLIRNSGGQDIVISSEVFSEEIDTNIFSKLANLYREVKVILYLRRQDLLVESAFNQMLKQYGFSNDNILDPPVYTVDFYKLIESWKKLVGAGNVIVRRYQRESLVGGNIIRDFMGAIGLGELDFPEENAEVVNESLTLLETRVLNVLAKYSIKDWGRFRDLITKHVKNNYADADAVMVGNYLDDESRISFFEAYDESNQKILDQYFAGEKALFSPPERKIAENINASIDPMQILVAILDQE